MLRPKPQETDPDAECTERRAGAADGLGRTARLLAYTQALGLEQVLWQPTRGIPSLVLALVWLVLAWRGTGRPHHVAELQEPLLAALLGRERVPSATTVYRSLHRCSAQAVRAAVGATYQAELPRRTERIWVSLDSHQLPYWGRRQRDRFQKGWAGHHGRRLRGYRLDLAVDTATGQIITFVLATGNTPDAGMAALLTLRVRQLLGRQLAGVVADSGFTSRASVAALLKTGVPFSLRAVARGHPRAVPSAPLMSMGSAPSAPKLGRSSSAHSARWPPRYSTSAGPARWSTSPPEFKLPDLR